MKQLLLFFGGKSCEHDISIITAAQTFAHINKEKYRVFAVYISGEGKWYLCNEFDSKHFSPFDRTDKNFTEIVLLPDKTLRKGKNLKKPLCTADCALICCHGANGEDGTLQGLLTLYSIPFSSGGTLSSALAMDKIAMKMVFSALGLQVLPYHYLTRQEFTANKNAVANQIAEKLGFPLFVKPSNLGSSIGISKSVDIPTLIDALDVAFCYDRRVLVEKAVNDIKEINCSAIRKGGEVLTSRCEEPVVWQDFLTFNEKYLNNGKQGMASIKRKLPADIDAQTHTNIIQTTKTVYNEFMCKGVIRVDYIMDTASNQVYINEINSIPGSLSFYLWEDSGVDFVDLIDILIQNAFDEHNQDQKNAYAYKSDVLKAATNGKK